ncbi:hypothetical protein GUJ93_ZPchr0004g38905 [Zizania palustris]|uniref:Uncharacterized protein n=1 Tax=Zizania palustris TaxID=103762 RepID=A0A8J5SNK9_ZIZPA|nr:hypothetical protein GUJ93_ZPchr0004g38905 [Zizania palustris]
MGWGILGKAGYWWRVSGIGGAEVRGSDTWVNSGGRERRNSVSLAEVDGLVGIPMVDLDGAPVGRPRLLMTVPDVLSCSLHIRNVAVHELGVVL